MANPYRELFQAPQVRAFVLAGLIARLPLPMMGIGIITMLSQLHGSYALAGGVAATFALTYALLSPQVSRLVDRYGQGRVLPVATLISALGVLGLSLVTWLQAPHWLLFVAALLTGCMPSMAAMVRARWTALYRGQAQLQTAFSLETVLDEVSFIAGPPLAIALSVMWFPQAGPLLAAFLLVLGVLWLSAQRASEPAIVVHDPARARPGSVLRQNDVQWLTLLMVALGVIVGTVDIASVAFAQLQGQPAAASLVLSAYATGACLAGLLFGAMRPQVPLPRLLWLGGLATLATTLPMLWVNGITGLAIVVFLAGLSFAPTMIVAMSLVEQRVPEAQLTEGMTWLLAGLSIGVALGAALSGQVVDQAGVRAAFLVAVGGAGMVLLVSVCAAALLQAKSGSSLQAS